MANMSYCRFRNTSLDLADCVDALENSMEHKGTYVDEDFDEISQEEIRAAKTMREQCERYIEAFDELFNG